MQTFEPKKYPKRTIPQNKALHLYFTLVADALNAAGYDLKAVLAKATVDVPNTGYTVKEHLWKPILKIQLGLDSTTKMKTVEIDQIYDTLNRFLADKFHIHEDFPSIETIIFNQRTNDLP